MAGEISERRGDSRTAVDYYAKGNNYARAVQLAKEVPFIKLYCHRAVFSCDTHPTFSTI